MTATEVLAIEVKQYTDADGTHQTIVPRVIGDTAEARAVKHASPGGERLDREPLVGSIREQSALAADAAEALLDWADREPRLDIRYTRTRGFIETAGRQLLKFYPTPPPKIQVTHQTLADTASRGTPSASSALCVSSPTSA